MPVVTIKITEEMFKTLKAKYPYHGDISRVIRNAIKAINKGLEFSPEGNILRINQVPVVAISISTHLSILNMIKDNETLKKLAIKNADNINEAFYMAGVHSKDAIRLLLDSLQLSNIIEYKWKDAEDQSGAIIVYIEKTIYPPRVVKYYLAEYIKYFCKINRLACEVTGEEQAPIFRITKMNGGVFV